MRSLTFMCFLLAFVLGSGCKDEYIPCGTTVIEEFSYDTIFPSNYLMAYPGSWWEYSSGGIDSCTGWTEASIFESNEALICDSIFEDRVILPQTTFGTIMWESKISFNLTNHVTYIRPLIGTEIGRLSSSSTTTQNTGVAAHGTNTYSTNLEVVELLDSLEVEGTLYYDLIHTRFTKTFSSSYAFGGYYETYDKFYANGVGMVLSEFVYNTEDYPTSRGYLVDYYIAPH